MAPLSLARPAPARLDRRNLIATLDRFREDTAAARQLRRKQAAYRMEAALAKSVAEWFVVQGERVVRVLSVLETAFDNNARRVALRAARTDERSVEELMTEALTPSDWEYLMNQALYGHQPGGIEQLRRIIMQQGHLSAYMAGADDVLDALGVKGGIAFGVGSSDAMFYSRTSAAARITRINNETRRRINSIIADSVATGRSWQKTAEAIAAEYADMAGPPLFPSKTFTSRAEAIAAYEIGDAYEAGSWAQAQRLRQAGRRMEKHWLNAGDSRVRPAHVANAAAGYLPADTPFPGDGAHRPPTDPGCRCTIIWRLVDRGEP